MPKQKNNSVATFRRRMKRQGIVRVEVQLRRDDAPLVRGLVKALNDPAREAETRELLRERFVERSSTGLKALLAAAPLEGIDLTRARDRVRDVEL